jgi:GDPmannose 4,6-dehydratase
MKSALITGITGQDGSYLAELLLSKGYEVHGIIRRASTFNTSRIDHIYQDPHELDARLFLHYGDVSDSEQISNVITNVHPDEIYNLAAQTHVRISFDTPEYTGNVTALGTARILESMRRAGSKARFYQASSSEMFGSETTPQNELTAFKPRSPYACSKVFSYFTVVNYREGYGMHASNGILFNHESPRRGETFVTRKVSRGVAHIVAKLQRKLALGNLEARRDWGYAPEYVEGMHRIVQLNNPGDFVMGTEESHSVREFVEEAFSYADLDLEKFVEVDRRYLRPLDPENLVADSTRARRSLDWSPKVKFKDLVKIMVDADMRRISLTPPGEGDLIVKKTFPNRWWKVD